MSVASIHAYRFQYLKSEKWQNVRLRALALASGKCEICGYESISNDAHHIWYPENIWETKPFQLVVLCRPCHTFVHAMRPECKTQNECDGKTEWLKFRDAVLKWREQQVVTSKCDNGEFTIDPERFLNCIRRLKGRLCAALSSGKPVNKHWLGKEFSPLFAMIGRART